VTKLAVTYKLQRDNAQVKYMATADTLDKTRAEIPSLVKQAKKRGIKTGIIGTVVVEVLVTLYILLKP
jgi:hypothetical protein